MKRLYLMITITNRVVGSGRFVDFYRAFGAPVVFTALGRGTASDDVLSYLGLEATEKAVLFSVVTPSCKETLVKELVSTMHLTAPGSGIAVCLPLSSIGGKSAMNYLTSGDPSKAPEIDIEEDESMKEAAYQLIVAIARATPIRSWRRPVPPEPVAAPLSIPAPPAPRTPGSSSACPLPRSGR